MPGYTVRSRRILGTDGRTLIAALDHGIGGISPLGALTQPELVVRAVVEGGADAVIVTPGIVRKCPEVLSRVGIIVRVDAGPTALSVGDGHMRTALSADDALRLGADGAVGMGIVGAPGESESLRDLERLAARCHEWGLVLVAEMLPGGLAAEHVDAEAIAIAARLGAELGADIIKIRYTGDRASFADVTAACYQPIVVLGGSRQDQRELVGQVRDAMASGAIGAAVGRNIWQHSSPTEAVRALAGVVHG